MISLTTFEPTPSPSLRTDALLPNESIFQWLSIEKATLVQVNLCNQIKCTEAVQNTMVCNTSGLKVFQKSRDICPLKLHHSDYVSES